jgi:hypothetical protein
MGRIFDALFKTRDGYMQGEISRRNSKNSGTLEKIGLNEFTRRYPVEMYNTIVSGGMTENRFIVERQLIEQAQAEGIAVLIVHCGNRFLKGLGARAGVVGGEYYDPVIGKDSDELADIMTDISGNLLGGNGEQFGLWSLLMDLLLLDDAPVTLSSLTRVRCDRIQNLIDDLSESGRLDNEQSLEFINRYGAVAGVSQAAQRLMAKLKVTTGAKPQGVPVGLDEILRSGGVAEVDIMSDTNDVLKELYFTDINRVMMQGQHFLLVVDELSLLSKDCHVDNVLLRNSANMSLLFAASDVPAMTIQSENNFQTLISGHTNIFILNHSSAVSAQKWASYLGQHFVQHLESSYGSSHDNMHMLQKQQSSNITVHEERRDIVAPEQITELLDEQSYVLEASERQIIKVALGRM